MRLPPSAPSSSSWVPPSFIRGFYLVYIYNARDIHALAAAAAAAAFQAASFASES